MIIVRLVLIGLALALGGFGLYPAMQYSNFGAYVMLGLAVVVLVFGMFLRSILGLLRHTVVGKILSIVVVLVVGYFGVVEGMILLGGQAVDPMPEAEAVVVLGAVLSYDSDKPSLELAYRLDKAVEYLGEYPNARVVVSGGQGSAERVSEAEAMAQYLVEAGVGEGRIVMEDESRNTRENLANSKKILEGMGVEKAVIITSDYHCFRAEMLAGQEGMDATCVPAPNVWWIAPADHFREFLAVTKAFIEK